MIKEFCGAKGAAGCVWAFVASRWATLDPTMSALLVLMVLEIVTGAIVRFMTASLNSNAMRDEVGRKALVLIMVAAGHLLSELVHLPFDPGIAVAGFYCACEFIGIIENCERGNVPIPHWLKSALGKFKTIADIEPDLLKKSVDR